MRSSVIGYLVEGLGNHPRRIAADHATGLQGPVYPRGLGETIAGRRMSQERIGVSPTY